MVGYGSSAAFATTSDVPWIAGDFAPLPESAALGHNRTSLPHFARTGRWCIVLGDLPKKVAETSRANWGKCAVASLHVFWFHHYAKARRTLILLRRTVISG
jgi:hypothetical protein